MQNYNCSSEYYEKTIFLLCESLTFKKGYKIMKKYYSAMVAIVAVLGGSSAAFAASGNSASASGVALATVVAPITLTHTASASLNFGKFTVAAAGGTVVVTTAGVGSRTSDVNFTPGSTTSADQFAVTGDPSRAFSIATTSGTIAAGPKTIAFTTSTAGSGTLDATGNATFSVGGTLTLVGTETAANYSGSYTATVTYN